MILVTCDEQHLEDCSCTVRLPKGITAGITEGITSKTTKKVSPNRDRKLLPKKRLKVGDTEFESVTSAV